jgi:DNA-cytosine methyltransferase
MCDKGINVLSLFDGMGCARIALDRKNVKVNKYYSSEIDKYAIKVTDNNYPDMTQLGDITKCGEWNIPEKLDLVIAGFPCQSYSAAGNRLGLEDLRGQLLYYALGIIGFYRPKYFILENVKGILNKKFIPVIDLIYKELSSYGYSVQHDVIDSSKVSAQTRKRVYFTNFEITQPIDKNIFLKDIIEDGFVGKEEGIKIGAIRGRHKEDKIVQMLEIRKDDKSNTLTTVSKDNVVVSKNYIQMDFKGKGYKSQDQRCYFKNGKHGTLPAASWSSKVKVLLAEDETNIYYRKLTPLECCRLQTVPEDYFREHKGNPNNLKNIVSNSQILKMLGNGMTIDVILHLSNNTDL